jgi:hypothetical protein
MQPFWPKEATFGRVPIFQEAMVYSPRMSTAIGLGSN